MNNQPDNHVDKVDSILERCSAGVGGMVSISGKWQDGIGVDEARSLLDQHYADLYRNKIPERREYESGSGKSVELVNLRREGYNHAISDITAQFNSSKGHSDEK